MPKEDRAKIVALIINSPEPDSSRHPSPGQRSYLTPSRSTNNHEVHFEDGNDHNPFSVLGENDEDNNDNGGVEKLNMNSLSIHKTLTHGADRGDPQEPRDSPDVARALTIMNAVSSPVNSETLERSVPNLLPGHIMRTLSTSCSVPSSSISSPPLSNTNQDVKWNYGESDKDKTSKPSKSRKNLWFNCRGKDGQEDNNVQLSANMLFISGDGNGGKRDDNAGSAEKGVSSTASTTTIPKDEVSTSSVNGSDDMTDTDRWGAAIQTEHKRLAMYDTFGGSQDKYKAIRDSGANISFCNDISLFNNRTSTVTVLDPQEKTSATGETSLVDRGVNVTVLSSESVRILHLSDETLDVNVLGDHEMENLKIGSAGGVVTTQSGEILAVFNEIAYRATGKSVISSIKVEDNGIHIDDRSTNHGGNQCITTYEGYVIPLDCVQGLMYMDIRPFTDDEAKTLPRVHFTRDIPWDPTRYDSTSLSNRMDAHDAYTFVDKADNKQYIRHGLDMEKEDTEFVNTLKDEIRRRGAMDLLTNDRAKITGDMHTWV